VNRTPHPPRFVCITRGSRAGQAVTPGNAGWSTGAGAHCHVQRLVGSLIASHKSTGQPFRQLTFLADLGFKTGDPGMDGIIERILAHRSSEGPVQLPTNISTHFVHREGDPRVWVVRCPANHVSLAQLGLQGDPRVIAAVNYLEELVKQRWLAIHCLQGDG
jgi:hypothetical protein